MNREAESLYDGVCRAWHAEIVEAYCARPAERVVDISARFGLSPSHVSDLVRRAVRRGEIRGMRGKGFVR